jgi:hypothetical protein
MWGNEDCPYNQREPNDGMACERLGVVESPLGTSLRDSDYEDRVRSLVLNFERAGVITNFEKLAQEGDGLFPADILLAARGLGLSVEMPDGSVVPTDISPHPSPATSEWFFTADTADMLARMLPGRTLCLGAPSIAAAKAKIGEAVTLVDVSPWASERFDLSSAQVELRTGFSVESLILDPGYDSAIIDPPWYFPSLSYWLHLASSLVNDGGTVLVPLLGELTRPSAKSDRMKMTDMASEIGPWLIRTGTVLYETPRFERRALERAGIILMEPWRRSDLLQITNSRPAATPRTSDAEVSDWSTFRFGDSLIAIKGDPNEDPEIPRRELAISGLGPDRSFVLDSVSRRDPRIAEANVWTSESTAAKCSNVAALRRLLESDFDLLKYQDQILFLSIIVNLELSL